MTLRLALLPWLAAAGAWLQAAPAQRQASERCRLQIVNVDREGNRVEIAPGITNYFAGGNVHMRCIGLDVHMWSDSLASYQGNVIQFIGRVRYRDSSTEMTADFGTYLRADERWEARDNVVLTNLDDHSTLRGPYLDYYRAVPGMRDTVEMYAERRPTVTIAVTDSLGRPEEPYLLVGDRVRFRGRDRVWAGGRVTIDRSDFRGRGDSLYLDTGPRNEGALIGNASTRRSAEDSFDLRGRRIDLALEQNDLTYVTAHDSASLVTETLELVANGIGIDLDQREVQQVLAWGSDSTVRPLATSTAYEVRGDSLAFDTPGQRLREIRGFRRAEFYGEATDTAEGAVGLPTRDFVTGDTVEARFTAVDSAGGESPALERLEARGSAKAYYRLRLAGQERASVSYSLADLIRIVMAVGDSVAVDSVIQIGVRDGVHLQPRIVRADSARADSAARRDTIPPARTRSARR